MLHYGCDASLILFKGKGNRKFSASEPVRLHTGEPLTIPGMAATALYDWDGDGRMDLIATGTKGTQMYPGLANGTFGAPSPIRAEGREINASYLSIVAADWDGDGIADLLFGHNRGGIHFYKGTGQKTGDQALQAPVKYLDPPSGMYQSPIVTDDLDKIGPSSTALTGWKPRFALYDWNGDGQLDFVLGDMRSLIHSSSPSEKLLTLMEEYRGLIGQYQTTTERIERQLENEFKKSDPHFDFWLASPKAMDNFWKRYGQEIELARQTPEFSTVSRDYFAIRLQLMQEKSELQHWGVWIYLQKPPASPNQP